MKPEEPDILTSQEFGSRLYMHFNIQQPVGVAGEIHRRNYMVE